jgi:proline iminopeptidase
VGFIKHALGKTFYRTFGRGSSDKLPIVCLHGGPGGSHFYFMPMKALSKSRRVIVYDQIGSGQSSALSVKDSNVKTLADDLHRFLKKMKIEHFHLLGTSWGGSLALEYYFRYKGEGVESLILQSPLVSTKSWEKDANALIKTLSKEDQKVIRYCLEVGATDSAVYQKADKEYSKRYVFRGKKSAAAKRYQKKFPNEHGKALYMHMWGPSEFRATGTLKTFDREKDLAKIKVPTLFIAGQYDEARPETMKRFSRKVQKSRVEVVRGASHAILMEKPRPMVRAVEKFAREVEASRFD